MQLGPAVLLIEAMRVRAASLLLGHIRLHQSTTMRLALTDWSRHQSKHSVVQQNQQAATAAREMNQVSGKIDGQFLTSVWGDCRVWMMHLPSSWHCGNKLLIWLSVRQWLAGWLRCMVGGEEKSCCISTGFWQGGGRVSCGESLIER